jgi:transmembrane sensor
MSSTEPEPDTDIDAQAVAWVVKVGDPSFTDWEAFERWLCESPAHRDAYHATAAAEAEIVALLASEPARGPVQQQPVVEPKWRWRRWAGGALAASIAAVVGYGLLGPAAPPQIYETQPGVHRTVTLADGSRIALNGGTRLIADGDEPRSLRLEHGQALFTVIHDGERPFRVAVGNATVVDVGTRFDIIRDAGMTSVAVADGVVLWNPQREAIRLGAGHRLRANDADSSIELSTIQPAAAGSWVHDQLSYDGVPLSIVAADVARTLGVDLVVAPTAATRPVNGVLRLDGSADAVVPRLAALIGVKARRDDDGWRLSAPP